MLYPIFSINSHISLRRASSFASHFLSMPRPLLSSPSAVRRGINACIDSPPKKIQFWLHSKVPCYKVQTIVKSMDLDEQQEIYRTKARNRISLGNIRKTKARRYEQDMKSRKPLLHAYPRIRPTIEVSKPPAATPHSWKGLPMSNATTFVGLDVHARSIKASRRARPQDGLSRRAYPSCVQYQCKRRRTARRV